MASTALLSLSSVRREISLPEQSEGREISLFKRTEERRKKGSGLKKFRLGSDFFLFDLGDFCNDSFNKESSQSKKKYHL